MANRFLKVFLAAAFLMMVILGCSGEENIKKEIEKANYCATKDECVDAGGKCPFGCYVYVNSREADRIKGLIDSFDSKCVYGCMSCEDVMCMDGRCTPVCEGKPLPS